MAEGVFQVIHQDNTYQIHFPDSGNAGWHISNIISGKDYPILPCGFKPERIIDIGANIGAAAFFFTRVYPEADCYCFEPSPGTFDFLRKNTSPFPQIYIYNYGLSDIYSTARLYVGTSQCLQNSLYSSVEVQDAFEDVQIKQSAAELEDILSGKRCLLKIDTEGCEVPILQDLRDLLNAVDILYLEYHSESDRRAIDSMLASQFDLWWAKTENLHRGNLVYVSHRLLAEWPHLTELEIRR